MDSLNLALEVGDGKVIAYFPEDDRELPLFRQYTHPETLESLPDFDMQSFSFNTKKGACYKCLGTGLRDKQTKDVACSNCKGARLNSQALGVKIDGMNIFEVTSLSLDELKNWAHNLQKKIERGTSYNSLEKKLSPPLLKDLLLGIDTCNSYLKVGLL